MRPTKNVSALCTRSKAKETGYCSWARIRDARTARYAAAAAGRVAGSATLHHHTPPPPGEREPPRAPRRGEPRRLDGEPGERVRPGRPAHENVCRDLHHGRERR